MAKHGVVRLDKVQSVYNGNIFSVVADEVLENGMIGVLGDLVDGERELHKIEAPTGTEKPLVIVASPEIMEDETLRKNQALANFKIEAGVPARAYTLVATDIVSVSKEVVEAIDSVAGTKVGNYVIAEAGSRKLKEVASVTGDEAFIGKIMQKELIGTGVVIGQAGTISRQTDYTVIQVKKNA